MNTTWRAGYNSKWNGMKLSDIKGLMGSL